MNAHARLSGFALALLAACALAACSTNVKKISETHVPDGSTDTGDKPIEARKRFQRSFKLSGVRFDTRFRAGAAISVTETSLDHFDVLIKPENLPINDSAWFAFRVSSKQPKKLEVRLQYEGGTHRYFPKLSADGKSWSDLEKNQISVSPDKKSAVFHLDVSARPIWVAAQEIIDSEAMANWIHDLQKNDFVKTEIIGHSSLGKAIRIMKIAEQSANPEKRLIVLGRQHPPEVTGTIALMSFVETLCDDSELSKKFRDRFETVVIPMINPDGVDDGHWRHNRHGVDLNRDWEHFRQKETRVVSSELEKLKDKGVVFGIDFHSTFKDVFYVLQDNTPIKTPKIAEAWIKDIAAAVPDYSYRIQPVTNVVPASLVWMNKTFGIDSTTYEVGDETDRARMRQIAKIAAEKLMQRLLN